MDIKPASETINKIIRPEVIKSYNNTSFLLIGLSIGLFALLSMVMLYTGYRWLKNDFELFTVKMMNSAEENNRKIMDMISDLIKGDASKSKIQPTPIVTHTSSS